MVAEGDTTPAAPEEPEAGRIPPPAPEPESASADAAAQNRGVWSGHRRLWIVLGAIAAVIVVLALALPVYLTLQPGYYERYPQLRARMHNWEMSTHAKVPCSGCHVDPGPIGFLGFSAKAIPDFYSQLVFGPKATNLLSVPDKEACQRCHTNYRQVSPGGDLLIPHRAHVVQLGMNCADCHKNLVHSVNTQGFNRPDMETCLRCHDGKTATKTCTACHTQKQVPKNHKRADWLTIHSTQTKTEDCGSCHGWSPDFCAQCHSQRPASHGKDWKQVHGTYAKEDPKRCKVCHKETFCKRCHD